MKQKIYNLIILDESGSMSCVWKQTISGCNETIDTIRAAQEKYDKTQEHFVSIFTFQSGGRPSRYLIKNVPAETVRHITEKDYEPCGCTPLYDAVGTTLVDLKATVKDTPMAIGNVTIITDGLENSSTTYTLKQVARMIDALKEMGWSFNFIGANIDVQRTAASLNIDNALKFQQDDRGTKEMFERERSSRMNWFDRAYGISSKYSEEADSPEVLGEYRKNMKDAARSYFQ